MSVHLEAIGSQPRAVGSEANAAARMYCAGQLKAAGFDVAEQPFEFSALPGRYAAPIIGGIAVAGHALTLVTGNAAAALLTIAAIGIATAWLARAGATSGRLLRERGVNLEARRGEPAVWLVAHIDSKSQPISSAMRTLAVLALAIPPVGALLLPVLTFEHAAMAGVGGGLLLAFCTVGSESDGAADNASGVAAVLEAAALIPREVPLGVLITDAEELALAGAAAWVRERQPGVAINCDTIDDIGSLAVFTYGGTLGGKAGSVASAVDPRSRVRRPPPGVLTDSNAFRRAGWETVTLSRGTIRTLNRIHTSRDSLRNIRGSGIPDAALALARLVEEVA